MEAARVAIGSYYRRMLTVADDSGFLGAIDPDAYEGFVGEDWTFESIFAHFANQMARHALLLWATSEESGNWQVDFGPQKTGIRSVTGPFVSTRGRLCLVSYENLTMAAQFADVILPESHMADEVQQIEPGNYSCTITQLQKEDHLPPPHFLVTLQKTATLPPAWHKPAWSN